MKKTLLYIHGYGSDHNSRKFLDLKNYFGQEYTYHCLEWMVESDIKYLLRLALKKCENISQLAIIGDSTGANLAYQLRELRKVPADQLILLSPLLDITARLRDIPFPKAFEDQLIKITKPQNALIIASREDEVINQTGIFNQTNNQFVLHEVKDGHRLQKFQEYLPVIKNYLSK
ncbi:hypothetical protein H1R16_02985 [Marnyiella aurantia]|uniref:Alpha/beta hydrolase n=1 Tax=Marnyiella aurantia TaxID=2758037 RepID=A0A7D7QWN7_9FLAO|nr:hypothetical protein [Marnyiella aurantia]MBA5245600.1 hypothetical protein [Marnyiella aurantia]QMS98990.1 hypothetical protein H1R16_02985 [Marnyiella aurantia]